MAVRHYATVRYKQSDLYFFLTVYPAGHTLAAAGEYRLQLAPAIKGACSSGG